MSNPLTQATSGSGTSAGADQGFIPPISEFRTRCKAERGPPSNLTSVLVQPNANAWTLPILSLGGVIFFGFTIGRIRLYSRGVVCVRDDGCYVTADFVDLPPAASRDHVVCDGLGRE